MGMLKARSPEKFGRKVIPNVKRETLQNEILNEVDRNATVTLTARLDTTMILHRKGFVHETGRVHLQEYVKGEVHT